MATVARHAAHSVRPDRPASRAPRRAARLNERPCGYPAWVHNVGHIVVTVAAAYGALFFAVASTPGGAA